eukprot:3152801-Prymnesium_polylepis.2
MSLSLSRPIMGRSRAYTRGRVDPFLAAGMSRQTKRKPAATERWRQASTHAEWFSNGGPK